MKMMFVQIKSKLSVIITSTLLLAHSSLAATPTATVVNPDTLKTLILDQNISLLKTMNLVEQAKAKVNIARGNLLPSINVGAAITAGPSFALSSIYSLVPFLLPSRWLDLKSSQYLLNGQTDAYYIAQLNTYSSAYSVYLTLVRDTDLHDVLQKQYGNYKQIEDLVRLGVQSGLMQPSALLQAEAQSKLAEYQVSQTNELLAREQASLREMLSLPLGQEILVDKTHLEKSFDEDLDMQTILNRSLAIAPEISQLDNLIKAGKYSKWSQAFSFLSGGSVAASKGSSGSFDTIQATESVNLGFALVPTLQLSNLNIEQLNLQKKELNLLQAQLVESTMKSLVEANNQFKLASEAEASLTQFYQIELLKFRTGLTDLLHVLTAANSLTISLSNKIKAQNDVDNLRVTLNRLLLTNKFTNIRPCKIAAVSGGIFHFKGKQVSLDQACGKKNP